MSIRAIAHAAAASALTGLSAVSGSADPRVSIVFQESSNPSAGGLYTEEIPGLSGDTIRALVVLTPDTAGVSSYSVSVDFDQDLLDRLDVAGATATPPPGWSDNFLDTIQESDVVTGGFVESLAAIQGAGSPLAPGVPFPIAEIEFLVNDLAGGPAAILPNLGHPGDGLLDAGGDPLAVVGLPPAQIVPFDPFEYDPSFRGRLADYGLIFDPTNAAKGKLKKIGKGVLPANTRGVVLTATETPGFGFFQANVPFAPPVVAVFDLDVSRLGTLDAFAGAELDSPYAPPGVMPANFVFSGAVRELDESLTLFASHNLVDVGTPFNVPPGVDVLRFEWRWQDDLLDVSGGPFGGVLTPILTDYPFAADATAGFGAGLSNGAKKDAVGVTYEITGDVHDDARQALLTDLQTVIDLEVQALADLDASMNDEAREKIESAKRKLDTGEPIPGSDPPATTPSLIQRINEYFEGKDMEALRRDVEKKLEKAAKKDESALDKLERGQTDAARRDVDKALTSKNQAKAILETLVRGEGKL